jgi:hypothetical protein
VKNYNPTAAPADGHKVKAAPAPVRVVNLLAARTGVPAADGRTVMRPRLDHNTVPVFVQRDKGRDLVGAAELELTDEGVVARCSIAPYAAAALEAREIHAHIELAGGYHSRDPLTIHGGTVGALFCSKAAPAWNDMWVEGA